ncbi:MAG: C39 family peptidase, partial [Chitinispirillaceae bacterium]|nr:C39 family peptidase [Chitinispirillaceae bacterium]
RNFSGWDYPGVRENCFDYALEQLRQVGRWVKSESWNKRWDGSKQLNDHIFQLYLEEDVAGMKKGVQQEQFVKGVEYLKEALRQGIPVIVGVDDDSKRVNPDLTTEHFVTIVGMGEDEKGKYFLFYDNAVVDSEVGTSGLNKLYCKSSQYLIEGTGDPRNRYIQERTWKRKYIVTQIRETK